MKIEYDLTYLKEAYHEEICQFNNVINEIKGEMLKSNYPLETIIAGLIIQEEIDLYKIYDSEQEKIKSMARDYLHNLLIDKDSAHDENAKYNPYSLF